jgi:porin
MPERLPPSLSLSTAIASSLLMTLLLTVPVAASEPASTSVIPGLDFEAELILDSIALIDGGASRGSAMLGKTALTLDLDTGKANLWNGGRMLVQVLGTFGDEPSSLAGDLQVFNNIEAGDDFGILEAWVEQAFGSRASLLVGYHDLNREFDVLENAGELLNSSFGIGPEISQIGPSLFPRTHLGARLEIRPTGDVYVKIAGYDRLSCTQTKGSFYAIESGWMRDRLGSLREVKIALGAWRVDPHGSDSVRDSATAGGYLLAEATYPIRTGATIGAFVRAGQSDDGPHPIERYTGAGVRFGGLVFGRPDDVVSVGLARADISSDHRLLGSPSAETTVELTWLARINDWLAIQPDIQYIDSPAGDIGISHALVGGIRLILTY